MAESAGQGCPFEDRVAIDENQKIMASVRDTGVECCRFTRVALPDEAKIRPGQAGDDVRRAVGRPVVYHDDLDLGIVTAP